MENKNLCKNLYGSLNQCEKCYRFTANNICIQLIDKEILLRVIRVVDLVGFRKDVSVKAFNQLLNIEHILKNLIKYKQTR